MKEGIKVNMAAWSKDIKVLDGDAVMCGEMITSKSMMAALRDAPRTAQTAL